MASLSREQRRALETVVIEARDVAEEAARKALEGLATGAADAHGSMNREQKALRNRLRAHGRQLGDTRNADKTQQMDRLVAECAYEQWHRMLFARFLAENQLLLGPDPDAPMSIEEVKDLARERGQDWVALAGAYAVKMLPQVFRQDDPVLAVQFTPEDRKQLEELLASLPAAVFTSSDALGWCYQFWQARQKDEVNAAGNKIGADELAAVTQLFTEDYMVDFLLDNTLGAWHAGKLLAANPKLAETASSEAELRQDASLSGCPWTYLRFIKGPDGKWTPAAGTFNGWPKTAQELRCLDPCMGSGHFVVAMFERLVALRMAEEKLDAQAAVVAVIRGNLFGLELDPRCTQIGAFNLALSAWRRVGHCALPAMNLACSGLAPNTREANWLAIAGGNERLQRGMERLYRLFQQAGVLGSLIDPHAGEDDLLAAAFQEIQPLLEKALAQEAKDDTAYELAVAARGLAKAAELLASRFTLIATNVPYLKGGSQDEALKEYCERVHPAAKTDLATCFVERCLRFCAPGASTALVTPQSWLFMGTYRKLRTKLLRETCWCSLARLGPHAFETIGGEVVNVALVTLSFGKPADHHCFSGIDAAEEVNPGQKAAALRVRNPVNYLQHAQLANPDARIAVTTGAVNSLLSRWATSYVGMHMGDNERFVRCIWEVPKFLEIHMPYQSPVNSTVDFGGRHSIALWFDGGRVHVENPKARVQGQPAWGKAAVSVRLVGHLPATLASGEVFEQSVANIVPRSPENLPAIWHYCSSDDFNKAVRRLDQALKVTSGTLVKIPFDLAHWQRMASERYPRGLPKPSSSDPTQWLFNGHPAVADQPLQVAMARLLGYQWPRQTGSSFRDCPALAPDGLEGLADGDGIVPIGPAKGEGPGPERLRELLARAFGKDWNATKQEELLAEVGYVGATLEDWLRNGFFEQHCALFHNRPFIWHIWDGLSDGFHALVNYHRLAGSDGGNTLQKLAFSYLGDWISRQKAEQKLGKEGADAKLAAAVHLQEQLKLVLAGEPPYDLFVRWKPLRQQAIGWDPDINDGVRLNSRPFMMAETLKGKSIFRKAPKIKWEKDRGKEPERARGDFPWFWGWDEETEDFQGGKAFDGNRWNDLHYSVAMKQEARSRVQEKKR